MVSWWRGGASLKETARREPANSGAQRIRSARVATTGHHGQQAFPQRKKRGLLSRNQASNNTGDNNTFAFAPGALPPSGHPGPKRRNPKPRRATQPEQPEKKKQDVRDFPWHSNHLPQRGRSCGWVGIGTFRWSKVASGSRSLFSRHFCIKLENCPPLAGSTGLVSANVRENF